MVNNILISIGIIVVLILVLIIVLTKKSNTSDKTDTYDVPQFNFPEIQKQSVVMDTPILTNHASMRMQERLGVMGQQQTELMNNAFKYGRTTDRTSGDLRAKLETLK